MDLTKGCVPFSEKKIFGDAHKKEMLNDKKEGRRKEYTQDVKFIHVDWNYNEIPMSQFTLANFGISIAETVHLLELLIPKTMPLVNQTYELEMF